MPKNEILFLEECVIIDFLSKLEDLFTNNKYIELLIALSLNKFCERQFGGKCHIGLELQDKFKKDIPKQGTASFEELKNIITTKVEENTPVDVVIAKMPENKSDVSRGMNFQIKRFGKNWYKQNTESLIDFLNIDCRSYAKTQASLIVLLETPEEIDLELLQKTIKIENYPFEKIILIGLSENKYINYYGIWPESGWSRFNLNALQFDF